MLAASLVMEWYELRLVTSGLLGVAEGVLAAAAGIEIGLGASTGRFTGPGAEMENIGWGGGAAGRAGSVGGEDGFGLVGLSADLSGGESSREGGRGVVARGGRLSCSFGAFLAGTELVDLERVRPPAGGAFAAFI